MTTEIKSVQTVTNEYLLNTCKQGTNISSALFWSTQEEGINVPRPDRNLTTLRNLSLWGGLLGLDHFYLRSPLTGFVKLLTFGGCGLWWLWDVAQTWMESKRVLNYGIVTPFDLMVNIGQGMITDKQNFYNQKSSFSIWMFGVIFGFLGIDMFVLDRFWLGFRKLFIFMVVVGVIQTIFSAGIFTSIYNGGFWGNIFNFIVLFFALGVFMLWFSNVRLLLTPEKIMTDGIVYSNVVKDSLGWIRKLYEDEKGGIKSSLADEWETIHKHYSVNDISGRELMEMFKIRHISEKMEKGKGPETETKTIVPEKSAGWPPITLLLRMAANIWEIIVDVCSKMKDSVGDFVIFNFTPPGIAFNMVTKIAKKVVGELGIDVKNLNLTELKTNFDNVFKNIEAKGGDLINQIDAKYGKDNHVVERVMFALIQGTPVSDIFSTLEKGVDNLPRMSNTQPTPTPGQKGGSRSELSSESQILGATVIALVAGGSLKGLIDYLMSQD